MLTSNLRFKKDMWEKISKEMQLPWRAAEAMHWQIGEVEMAQRANVPVFHLAGQHATQGSERESSVSPPSANGTSSAIPYTTPYPHLHHYSVPQMPIAPPHSASPVEVRLHHDSNGGGSLAPPHLRPRADSARSVPPGPNRMVLPPVGEIMSPSAPTGYTLPPVGVSSEAVRR